MPDLTQRLTELEAEMARQRDHLEIRQLIASYGPMVDTALDLPRASRVAELWTEDGVYDIGAVGSKSGRAEIAHAYEARHFRQAREGICHVMGPPFVQLNGDHATALNYSCVFRPDGENRFYAWRVAANKWELSRVEGRWLVKRRTNRLMNGDSEALAMLGVVDAMVETGDRSPD